MTVSKHHSYGIVPLVKKNGEWFALIVKLHSGKHWSFPKGHAEQGETPLQAAQRELHEETGLTVTKLLSEQILRESYFFRRSEQLISKDVDYFLAEVEGEVLLQPEEIAEYQWVPLEKLVGTLTYPQARSVAENVIKIIEKINKTLD